MKRAWQALAAYAGLSLVVTWPLAGGLARDVAWDLGDSILNMWILSWDAEQILAILAGDVARLATFFDGNIFYPERLTLAYSEHLVPQALQILPVYAVSRNPILCYNLLFLSTFALSGLGMYLLVRQMTGNTTAAFVAGLLFAFAPYRLGQSSHLQVLSSQWMPFTLYGFARYFETRRLRPLVGGTAALVAQNLSCGYYLLYFTPFVVMAVVWDIARRRIWRDRRMWLHLAAAGLAVVVLTAPFIVPYIALRGFGFTSRSIAEVSRLSADVYSYVTTFPDQRIWGNVMQAFPKPEGELFPGVVPVVLAVIGVLWWRRPLDPRTADAIDPQRTTQGTRWLSVQAPRWVIRVLAAIAVVHAAAAVLTLILRRIVIDVGPFVLSLTDIDRLLLRAAIPAALLLAVSPATRRRAAAALDYRGFLVTMILLAMWLSLGPNPRALGRPLEIASPYGWLYEHVPGFDGVRVPARLGMIVALGLAALGGYGAAVLSRRRAGRAILVVGSMAFLLEATHVPFIVNGMAPLREFTTPDARLYRPERAPAVYHEMARQPAGAVVAELPIGYPDFDLRAMFYSLVHWRPILNGYSGFYPPHYPRLAATLLEIPRHPDLSIEALRASGATHVILHEAAYLGTEGPDTAEVLRAAGATEIFRDGTDVLFLLPR